MSKKIALGKGMDGLLPVGFDVGSVAEPGEKIVLIKLEIIQANPSQPRKSFDEDALAELTDSIREHGVIQPIIVSTKNENGIHELIAGERRWRASQRAGLKTIPAIVRDTQAQQKLEIAIIENVQRVDLSPLEEAMSMYRLKQEFSLGLQEIAKKLGKATTTVSNTMRLLQLPEEAKNALMNNKITEGHARTILSLTDEKQRKELLNKIIAQHLSVREAESLAKRLKQGVPTAKPSKNTSIALSSEIKKQLGTVSSRLGSAVRFNDKKSQLVISVDDEKHLKKILSYLQK